MRQIALDTETTGLEPKQGHRLIEIGCVELLSGRRSGAVFHAYINPQRSIPAEAIKVHGLEESFLRKHPTFDKVAQEFLDFIADDELIIHNAAFDLGFLNAELANLQRAPLQNKVIDTLLLARKKYPNQSNRLDALCQRFSIDLSARAKHGALIDAGLLAEVYIALTAANQTSFLDAEKTPSSSSPPPPPPTPAATAAVPPPAKAPRRRPARRHAVARLTEFERTQHQQMVGQLKSPLWREFKV